MAYFKKMTPEQESQHLKQASNEELCAYLAAKIRRSRKLRKESQVQFAARAGIALRTYKRLETYGQGHLETFLKALSALDRCHYLNLLFPFDQPKSRALSLEERLEIIRKRHRESNS
ncbi:hypothetical protein [Janthinobacterium sp. B9-8]|uniref:hypothetical protein n=1 Tax=Janthinobacterium sp. B9-8 TaxID=1236179 RepID=UPI0012E3ACF9|nr:hypothetical protein [Janthinobacterium sp. B9-8]